VEPDPPKAHQTVVFRDGGPASTPAVPREAAIMRIAGKPLTSDKGSAFFPMQDRDYDNDTGINKIAERWYETLKVILEMNEKPRSALQVCGAGAKYAKGKIEQKIAKVAKESLFYCVSILRFLCVLLFKTKGSRESGKPLTKDK
jgi:hypothetical protein